MGKRNDSRATWLEIWRGADFNTLQNWNSLCELVYYLLMSLLRTDLKGKTVLEMGSGTGRISLELAEKGANTMLLDISPDAIRLSKELFKSHHIEGTFILGDVFLPPFRHDALDVIWSSGVLEHFTPDEIGTLLDDTLRILKKNGSLVVIVPSKKACVYDFFRRLDMRLGRWKLGYEEPWSYTDLYRFRSKPIEYLSTGFVHQFRFFSLPILSFIVKLFLRIFSTRFGFLDAIDKKAPGYLIGALWKKGRMAVDSKELR